MVQFWHNNDEAGNIDNKSGMPFYPIVLLQSVWVEKREGGAAIMSD